MPTRACRSHSVHSSIPPSTAPASPSRRRPTPSRPLYGWRSPSAGDAALRHEGSQPRSRRVKRLPSAAGLANSLGVTAAHAARAPPLSRRTRQLARRNRRPSERAPPLGRRPCQLARCNRRGAMPPSATRARSLALARACSRQAPPLGRRTRQLARRNRRPSERAPPHPLPASPSCTLHTRGPTESSLASPVPVASASPSRSSLAETLLYIP